MVRRTIAIRDGRTATETLRHGAADDSGALGHAVEYAVLDRAGRLQLPREMTEALGMRDRVRLEAEVDHIGVWPDTRELGDTSDGHRREATREHGRRARGDPHLRQRRDRDRPRCAA